MVKLRKYDLVYVKFYDHYRVTNVPEDEYRQYLEDHVVAAVGIKLHENRKYLYIAQQVGYEITILAIFKPAIIKIVKLKKAIFLSLLISFLALFFSCIGSLGPFF